MTENFPNDAQSLFQMIFSEDEYRAKISRMVVEGKYTFTVKFADVYNGHKALGLELINHPDATLKFASDAAVQRLRIEEPEFFESFDTENNTIKPRVIELYQNTPMRDVGSEHIGTLIMVTGIIMRATGKRPKVYKACFECKRCGTRFLVEQKDHSTNYLKKPMRCPAPDCGGGEIAAAIAGVGLIAYAATHKKTVQPQQPQPHTWLDVGITIYGTPYFDVSDVMAEFANFIQSRSQFILNIHLTQLTNLIPLSEFSTFGSTDGSQYPDLGKLDSSITSYFTYPVNMVLYADEGIAPTYAGLTWIAGFNGKSVCILPCSSDISWMYSDPNWTIPYTSAVVHEFLNGIGVCPDCNATPWGYTGTNDPGWIRFYTALLSALTTQDYQNIANGTISSNLYQNTTGPPT